MKMTCRTYFFIMAFIAEIISMIVCSCDGFEISDNGNLDGMWHLIEVDSLAKNVKVDYIHEGIYWSIQDHLLCTEDKLKRYETCVFHFVLNEGKLTIKDPHFDNRVEGDPQVVDLLKIAPFGVNKEVEEYKVETLNKKHLVIVNQMLKLSFKKY